MRRLPLAIALALLAACGAAPARMGALPAPLTVAHAGELPSAEPTPDRRIAVREIDIEGLHALEVVLGDAGLDDPLPTIWAFHGRGDRPRMPGREFDGLSRPIRIVIPQAPDALDEGFTWLPFRVAEGRTEELALALRARAEELAQAIRLHEARVPYVGRPIVTGFSQGGVLCFALAVLHPDLVSSALPNSGWLPPALEPSGPDPTAAHPPIRSTHGTADSIVAFEPTRLLVARLAAAGLDAVLEPFEGVGHLMSAAMSARFHAWLEEAVGRAAAQGEPALGEAAQ